MKKDTPRDWKSPSLGKLAERLTHVQRLLRQAAAVSLTQDAERLERLADAHTDEPDAHKRNRRYR